MKCLTVILIKMRRDRNAIILQILEICSEGASKTKIVYKANLNFRAISPYLDLLLKKDMICVKQESPTILYNTTPYGKTMIESIKNVHSSLPLHWQGSGYKPASLAK